MIIVFVAKWCSNVWTNLDTTNNTNYNETKSTCTHTNTIPYSRKIWRELNLTDWAQPARTKILADFNLVDDLYSHALNLSHAHACLRSLRGVAC